MRLNTVRLVDSVVTRKLLGSDDAHRPQHPVAGEERAVGPLDTRARKRRTRAGTVPLGSPVIPGGRRTAP